jgi:hypothetical protein
VFFYKLNPVAQRIKVENHQRMAIAPYEFNELSEDQYHFQFCASKQKEVSADRFWQSSQY